MSARGMDRTLRSAGLLKEESKFRDLWGKEGRKGLGEKEQEVRHDVEGAGEAQVVTWGTDEA